MESLPSLHLVLGVRLKISESFSGRYLLRSTKEGSSLSVLEGLSGAKRVGLNWEGETGGALSSEKNLSIYVTSLFGSFVESRHSSYDRRVIRPCVILSCLYILRASLTKHDLYLGSVRHGKPPLTKEGVLKGFTVSF